MFTSNWRPAPQINGDTTSCIGNVVKTIIKKIFKK